MALLGGGELELCDNPAGLGGIVVLDRGLEVLSERLRLAELAAQPALEADARGAAHGVATQTACRFVVRKPSRS